MTRFQQPEVLSNVENDSVMTRTMDGIISFWNRSAEKLYGWRKEEAIGKRSHDLLHTQFPEPLEEIKSELVRTGIWTGKLVHTTRDGRRMMVESRWILKSEAQSRNVVEINRVAADRETLTETSTASNLIRAETALTKIANIILAGGGVFCFLVFAYFVYHYSWTGERYFTSSWGILVYYVLPVILAGFLFASIKLPAAQKIRVAFFLCAMSLPFYIIELWFSLPFSPASSERSIRAKAAKKFGVAFDSRSIPQVIADLRSKGIDAYPYVASSYLTQTDGSLRSKTAAGEEFWPLGSISNKVSVLCNEGGNYTIQKSDEHGFLNPTGIWNAGKIDIATLGDSYTHGWCVPSDKNFVALIRERYPLTLNLGVAGNGPLTELAALKEYLPSLRPSVVLWFYHEGTDPKDLKREKNSSLLMRYLNGTFAQGLLDRQVDIDRVLTAYVDGEIKKNERSSVEEIFEEVRNRGLLPIMESIVKLGQVRQRLGLNLGVAGVRREAETEFWEVKDLFRQVLLQANTMVDEWGGELYFVYLPDFRTDWERVREDREEVIGVVSKLGIPIIDVHRDFQQHSDPPSLFPFRMPGHYNVEGHQLVAETVLQSIAVEN
jgi:PAS domain S-box-containing protein